ncbi:MAG TPA: DUF192 domain-containing protein [Aurantimonas sp.]|uniref:DUF192 domain-containing protein n=1 Tax=Aurantimonas marianensis TaxID=2920428 RepID=A0A9X2H388_9HYPH|nr:DUF192 domain-containing protein [Aurantimonas marianensis]MCP3054457.1 DUF192 domain-containing protein [Aurantimonas marianensis]
MLRKPTLVAGFAVFAFLAAAYFAIAAGDLSSATLVTRSGEHEIDVELALTPKDREVGLMNRTSMPAGQGMLFSFDTVRPVTMWMKNTLIPLDMLFLDEAGTVTHIKTNAQPLSLDLIPSGGPVRYVLELNGGAAARYGAQVGDRLKHEIIPAS